MFRLNLQITVLQESEPWVASGKHWPRGESNGVGYTITPYVFAVGRESREAKRRGERFLWDSKKKKSFKPLFSFMCKRNVYRSFKMCGIPKKN